MSFVSTPTSRSHSRSILAANWEWSSPPNQEYDSSVLEGVSNKLAKLPQYQTQNKYELRKLAQRLASPADTAKFFSDYVRERRNVFVVVPSPQQPQVEDQRLSLEETLVLEDVNRERLVGVLSDFAVKLHVMLDRDSNSIRIVFQVGDQIVEWTKQNVIIPHKNVLEDPLFTIDLSECLMKMLVMRRQHAHLPQDGIDDRILRLCHARSDLIEHVAKQITLFNRYYYHEAGHHDSQDFIKNLLAALNCESLPVLSTELSEYITDLRSGQDIFPFHEDADHEDLDNYVSEHKDTMDDGLSEYLALLYYTHHLKMRAEASDAGSKDWKCPREQCQLKTLKLSLLK